MRLTDFLHDVGRPVVFYPRLNDIFGGMAANVLLNQLLYWSDKGNDPDGWIYKSREDIKKETGLGRDSQEGARQALRLRGFLMEKFSHMPRRLLFRLNLDAINEAWEEAIYQHKVDIPPAVEGACFQHKVDIPPSIRRETHQQEGGKAPSKKVENPPAYTEMTTEMTTENKHPSVSSDEETSPQGVRSHRRQAKPREMIPEWTDTLPWPTPASLAALYNAKKPESWSATETLSDARLKKCRDYLTQFPDRAFWERTFANIHQSTWLRDGMYASNRSLDWLLQKGQKNGIENCLQVAEGRYRDADEKAPERRGTISQTGPTHQGLRQWSQQKAKELNECTPQTFKSLPD